MTILVWLNEALEIDDIHVDVLAEELAWMAHVAHLYLVRASLAGEC
jgi:hypothetical protein